MEDQRRDFESELKAVYPALARAAVVLCWSRSDVDDVVQETLFRGFRSYGSFRGGASFLTWMYVILMRVAAAANRQREKRASHDLPADLLDRLPPVDAAAIADEQSRAVIDAIRSLPQRQREMATLHYLQELTYPQIAEALGVSVGTVKATLFTARMSLRDALSNQLENKGERHVPGS